MVARVPSVRVVVDDDMRAAFAGVPAVSVVPGPVVEVLRPAFLVDDAPLLDAEAGAIVAELVIAAFSAAAFSAAALRSGFGALAGRSGIGSGSATLALAPDLACGLGPSEAAVFVGAVFVGADFVGAGFAIAGFAIAGFAIAGTSAVTAFCFGVPSCARR